MSDPRDERDRESRDFVVSWRGTFEFERPVPGDDAPTLPFAGVFASRLAAARARLEADEPDSRIGASARDGMLRSLERLLCDLCARPLQSLFGSSRQARAGSAGGGYEAFVERVRDDGPGELFHSFPRLESLVKLAERSWLDASRELSRRVVADHPLLERAFGGAEPLGRLLEVDAGLSDRHDGGRCVAALTFESGARVYYKPRDVGLELEYNRLLETLNAEGAPSPLRRLEVLDRGGEYGWVEAAEAQACGDQEQVRVFYRRAGALTALGWLLDATDLHRSNIVACGEDPVLVDAETFFQTGGREASSLRQLAVLPRLESDGGVRVDISGLGGAARQPTGWRIPEWRRLGRDGSRLQYRPAYLRQDRNAVLLDGELQSVTSYSAELLAGFAETYRFLAKRSEALLADGGPLRSLASRTRRVVVRRTRDYYGALNSSLRLGELQVGIDPDRLLAGLLGEPSATPPGASPAQVLDREVRALRRLDIPRFVHRPSGTDGDFAWGATRERMRDMGSSGLEAHLSEIRTAIATRILERRAPADD